MKPKKKPGYVAWHLQQDYEQGVIHGLRLALRIVREAAETEDAEIHLRAAIKRKREGR